MWKMCLLSLVSAGVKFVLVCIAVRTVIFGYSLHYMLYCQNTSRITINHDTTHVQCATSTHDFLHACVFAGGLEIQEPFFLIFRSGFLLVRRLLVS